ncbi:MAG: C45 family peptidase, partial [Patescibacteria group bacterium]
LDLVLNFMLKNYYEFTATNNFNLGLQMGRAFAHPSRARLLRYKKTGGWKKKIAAAEKVLALTEHQFPHLVEELRGYALGAKINFGDIWTVNLFEDSTGDKCTTIISNGGRLLGHSEDFDGAKNDIAVVKKTIGGLTILEIFYFNTLGGNAVSINSSGFVHAANSLFPADRQAGIPHNVIARWLSETKNPVADFARLKKISRDSGYNHNFINLRGQIFNIESTAKHALLSEVSSPFIHTNHYLSILKKYEAYKKTSSFRRYDFAKKHLAEKMTLQKIKYILGDVSEGKTNSIRNKETVGNVIIDLEKRAAYIWLLRENKKGFVRFELDFLPRS